MFCPNCGNSLDITKNIKQKNNLETNSALSITDSENIEKSTSSPTNKKEDGDNGKTNVGLNIYQICKSCGFMTELKEKMAIFGRSSDTSHYSDKYKNHSDFIHDQTLLNTRKYTCPNKECKSHTDYSVKEAVYKRINPSEYKLRYICKACKVSWLN